MNKRAQKHSNYLFCQKELSGILHCFSHPTQHIHSLCIWSFIFETLLPLQQLTPSLWNLQRFNLETWIPLLFHQRIHFLNAHLSHCNTADPTTAQLISPIIYLQVTLWTDYQPLNQRAYQLHPLQQVHIYQEVQDEPTPLLQLLTLLQYLGRSTTPLAAVIQKTRSLKKPNNFHRLKRQIMQPANLIAIYPLHNSVKSPKHQYKCHLERWKSQSKYLLAVFLQRVAEHSSHQWISRSPRINSCNERINKSGMIRCRIHLCLRNQRGIIITSQMCSNSCNNNLFRIHWLKI